MSWLFTSDGTDVDVNVVVTGVDVVNTCLPLKIKVEVDMNNKLSQPYLTFLDHVPLSTMEHKELAKRLQDTDIHIYKIINGTLNPRDVERFHEDRANNKTFLLQVKGRGLQPVAKLHIVPENSEGASADGSKEAVIVALKDKEEESIIDQVEKLVEATAPMKSVEEITKAGEKERELLAEKVDMIHKKEKREEEAKQRRMEMALARKPSRSVRDWVRNLTSVVTQPKEETKPSHGPSHQVPPLIEYFNDLAKKTLDADTKPKAVRAQSIIEQQQQRASYKPSHIHSLVHADPPQPMQASGTHTIRREVYDELMETKKKRDTGSYRETSKVEVPPNAPPVVNTFVKRGPDTSTRHLLVAEQPPSSVRHTHDWRVSALNQVRRERLGDRSESLLPSKFPQFHQRDLVNQGGQVRPRPRIGVQVSIKQKNKCI